VSVSMPKELKEHLFDLENNSDDVSINVDLNQNRRNFDDLEESLATNYSSSHPSF
jgi:hypothetical protein